MGPRIGEHRDGLILRPFSPLARPLGSPWAGSSGWSSRPGPRGISTSIAPASCAGGCRCAGCPTRPSHPHATPPSGSAQAPPDRPSPAAPWPTSPAPLSAAATHVATAREAAARSRPGPPPERLRRTCPFTHAASCTPQASPRPQAQEAHEGETSRHADRRLPGTPSPAHPSQHATALAQRNRASENARPPPRDDYRLDRCSRSDRTDWARAGSTANPQPDYDST
jgi:hypothetical protein